MEGFSDTVSNSNSLPSIILNEDIRTGKGNLSDDSSSSSSVESSSSESSSSESDSDEEVSVQSTQTLKSSPEAPTIRVRVH